MGTLNIYTPHWDQRQELLDKVEQDRRNAILRERLIKEQAEIFGADATTEGHHT
jgi:hypothetical protein